MSPSPDSTTLSIQDLRAEFDGHVIGPDDHSYDEARTVFIGGVDLRPAAIIRPRTAAEVARVVRLARDTGLALAVRSGGHSAAAHGVVDGGIVLDLAAMRALDIDVESRTAWAEAGLTAGEYTQAASEHGLATGFGDTGSVGIGGITLGGGVGFLARKYGLTIDDVLAAEVVTADGTVLMVDADNHPELFWAIRGGGGNFGVVTRFKYRLHELPSIVGGMLMLPATAAVLTAVMAAASDAPDELSGIFNVMPAPPMPFIPEEQHGQLVIMALMCFAGPAHEGETALAPFRTVATPIVDMLQTMPYAGMFQPDEGDYHPTAAVHTMFMDRFDRTDAETILSYLNDSDAVMRVTQLRVLGGAISRIAPDATAYAHRGSAIMTNVAAFYTGPDDKPVRHAWVQELGSRLRQDDTGAYVNFLDGSDDRVMDAYPGKTWSRLTAIKAMYDPENLFQRNYNIPPAIDS